MADIRGRQQAGASRIVDRKIVKCSISGPVRRKKFRASRWSRRLPCYSAPGNRGGEGKQPIREGSLKKRRVHVIHDGDTFPLQCGSGLQRVSWIGRVAAQRLGSGGIWCPPEKEIGRPKEFIPGRIYVYPGDDELDTEATIASLVEGEDGESEVGTI
jgi:hypothetical protein